MKVSISTENLQKHLSLVNQVISSRVQLPILQNILVNAKKNSLEITGTDLEMGIQTNVTANVEEGGVIVIPAKSFHELIGMLTDKEVIILSKEKKLEVRTAKTVSDFPLVSHDDFPSLYKELGKSIMSLDIKTIYKDLPSLLFAASTDTTRPALSGVLVTTDDGELTLVATDGYRLSLKKILIKDKEIDKSLLDKALLVPVRVLREVVSAKDFGEEVELLVSSENNQASFKIGETLIVGRLIDAEFPSYKKIIPQDHATKAVFEGSDMYRAVKICSIFAREAANIIKFSIKKNKILVSAASPSVGENTVEVEASVAGEENDIAFNARYLLDIFSHLGESEVVFEMSGPLNPGVFKIKDDPAFLHLIMPIRIQA